MPEILDDPNKFERDMTYRNTVWARRHEIYPDIQPQLSILLEIFDKLNASEIRGRHDLLLSHLQMIRRYCKGIENLVDIYERLRLDEQASQDRTDALARLISTDSDTIETALLHNLS